MPPRYSVVPSVTHGIHDTLAPPGAPEMSNELQKLLESEMGFLRRAFKLKMGNIIYPLQELSFHNSYVTDQLWVLILPALWSTLEKSDQYSLVKPITSLMEKSYNETQNKLYPNVLQVSEKYFASPLSLSLTGRVQCGQNSQKPKIKTRSLNQTIPVATRRQISKFSC